MAVYPGMNMQGKRKKNNTTRVKGNTMMDDPTRGNQIQRLDIINIYNVIISKTVPKQCY